MSTIEIKKEIIERLSSIDDLALLEKIRTLVRGKIKPNYIEMDDEFAKELQLVKEDALLGNYTTEADLEKKLNHD